MDERRVLILGSGGQLGTALCDLFPESISGSRPELDLTDLGAIPAFITAVDPVAVVNAAAYTAVDAAENDEVRATLVNGEAVGALAVACAVRGIPFVTFSTDYVFAGSSRDAYVESSPVAPINAYGRSKLVGERLSLGANPRSLVIRTSWVLSATHDNFVSTIIDLARRGTVRVVDDQWGKPTVATDLARATAELLLSGASGLAHVTNQGATSWYQVAREAVRLAGLDVDRVVATTTAEFPRPARRPAYSVLATERSDVPELPAWEDSLVAVVAGQVERRPPGSVQGRGAS